MTEETDKRPAPISYRPPKGREAEFAALVSASGLSTNAFITDRIFRERRRDPAQRQELALLLKEAADISDGLHDIALTAGHSALEIEALHARLSRIRAGLLVMMGRKP
jgi:hypothetical protein